VKQSVRGFVVLAALAIALTPAIAARTLDIYFIDVEGGQSTLIVTPSGQSLLVDTGFAVDGRDPRRIMAALHDAGVTRIDYLLITHFHGDHDGGVVELARQIPIGTFIDHGGLAPNASEDSLYEEVRVPFEAYVPVRAKAKHLEPKPGDRLPLKGVDAVFVSSAGATIVKPVAGAGEANPVCPGGAPPPGERIENPRSTGFHLRFGKFRFVDLGDLSGAPLFALICPNDLLGPVDLYLLPHHGGSDTAYPATFAAVRPLVAIVNNGPVKGGTRATLTALRSVPGLQAVWQLHASKYEGAENFAEGQIANLDETTSHWIKASAKEDGSFTVTNGRTGVTENYSARAVR
jgi:beta-lactamase superfamily II metal-dependent hydrolase